MECTVKEFKTYLFFFKFLFYRIDSRMKKKRKRNVKKRKVSKLVFFFFDSICLIAFWASNQKAFSTIAILSMRYFDKDFRFLCFDDKSIFFKRHNSIKIYLTERLTVTLLKQLTPEETFPPPLHFVLWWSPQCLKKIRPLYILQFWQAFYHL